MSKEYCVKEYGSEFPLNNKYSTIQKAFSVDGFTNSIYFRSGRDAIGFIAKEYRESKRVLMPSYSCKSMVQPFINNDYQIIYYKLTSDFQVDITDIYKKLDDNTILLYIDYFGKDIGLKSYIGEMRDLYSNIIIIEDRTHDLFSEKQYSDLPDYIVSSLRKWLALPDGGILFSNHNIHVSELSNDCYFFKMRMHGMKIKHQYLLNGNILLKDEYRRMLSNAENYLDRQTEILGITNTSKTLFECCFDNIKENRNENYRYLYDIFYKSNKLDYLLFNYIPKCPIYFPIITNNRNEVQKRLAENSIYCPVIWPITDEAREVCSISYNISEHILSIPCDQRYNHGDMEYVGEIILKILEEIN